MTTDRWNELRLAARAAYDALESYETLHLDCRGSVPEHVRQSAEYLRLQAADCAASEAFNAESERVRGGL
jgi:hypothetical protein